MTLPPSHLCTLPKLSLKEEDRSIKKVFPCGEHDFSVLIQGYVLSTIAPGGRIRNDLTKMASPLLESLRQEPVEIDEFGSVSLKGIPLYFVSKYPALQKETDLVGRQWIKIAQEHPIRYHYGVHDQQNPKASERNIEKNIQQRLKLWGKLMCKFPSETERVQWLNSIVCQGPYGTWFPVVSELWGDDYGVWPDRILDQLVEWGWDLNVQGSNGQSFLLKIAARDMDVQEGEQCSMVKWAIRQPLLNAGLAIQQLELYSGGSVKFNKLKRALEMKVLAESIGKTIDCNCGSSRQRL